MYLKKLEISGFKSFAHKTELYFEPGMTAIVGPNGSGKSNILDAIYWVLGEQSPKMLRGNSMQDVIFAGNSKRRGAGRAEVSLILDNTDGYFPLDFSEVKVTRRVLKSGESEYLINQTSCRLKDIHELFADKGIGKEAYTLIGQGKIDHILNAKPEVRRRIIEEAAGVTKYRWKKQETEKKLSETQGHLYRVNDLLQEVMAQVGPLKEQAAKARQYKELKAEQETLALYFLRQELLKTKQSLHEGQVAYEDLQKQQAECKAQIAEQQERVESSKEKIAAVRESMDALYEILDQDKERIEALQRGQTIDIEAQKHLESDTARVEEEINRLKEKQIQTSRQLEDSEQERGMLLGKIEVEKTNLTAMEEAYKQLEGEILNKQNVINETKEKFFAFLNELADARNQLHRIEEKQKMLSHKCKRLLEEKQAKTQQRQEIENRLESGQAYQIALQKEQLNIKEDIDRHHHTLEGLGETIKRIKQETESCREKERTITSRLNAIKGMDENYEGYYGGVKGVLRAAKQNHLKGICGSVAQLIQVPKNYEKAIEVALGGTLQNIVALSAKDVEPAIEYLKQHRLGRATFLPIDVLSVSPLATHDRTIIEKEGALGVASELVNYEVKYENVFAFILGRVIVGRDFAHARKLAKTLNYRYKVVTLEGEVINPGGAMTGGSLGNKNSSLIGRKRVLKELEDQEAEIKKIRLQKEKEEQSYIEKANQLQEELAALQTKHHQKDIELTAAEKDVAQWQEQYHKLTSDFRLIESEEETIHVEAEQVEKDKEVALDRLVYLQNQEETRQAETVSLEETLKQEQQRLKEMLTSITDKKMCLATWEEKDVAQKKAVTAFRELMKEQLTQIKNKEQEKANFMIEKERLEQRIAKLQAEIESLKQQKQSKELDLHKYRIDMKSYDERLSQHEAIGSEWQEKNAKIQENLYSQQRKVDRLQMQWDVLVQRSKEEYATEAEEVIARFQNQPVPQGGLKRLKEIKQAIRELGEVNVGAISLYEEMSQREMFLRDQYNDLMESKNTLERIISEMDKVVKERFYQTFIEVNRAFEEIFALLFSGGRAQLVLTQPDELLETGIEINAQPKGKKLQSISLLSGGEKAMTALALLFALLHVKPSPFCILDEVEAALDEANVERLGNYLENLSEKTQIIVITHRKETMAKAQVLYGVTMQEVGVSKLVSMKLTS